MTPRLPTSTLFPYATLFRSIQELMRRLDTYMGVCVKMGEELQALQQLAAPLPERLSKLEQSDPTMISDRKSTRLNSSHVRISYAVFCLKKKKQTTHLVMASQ